MVSPLRIRKTPAEVAALRAAGEAIDRVHANVPNWLKAGQTERQVGVKIAEAIFAEGHISADFVIVGSGPNAASPHHEVSDRVIQQGDVVVVDIGGTMPSGYCSDCTRTYAVGSAPDDFTVYYEVLKRAQEAATVSVKPGVTAEGVDQAARAIIDEAGYGEVSSSTAPATGSAWCKVERQPQNTVGAGDAQAMAHPRQGLPVRPRGRSTRRSPPQRRRPSAFEI